MLNQKIKSTKDKQLSNLVVSLDSELKSEVKSILEELGLNQSMVVAALYKEISRTKKVPLSFDLNDNYRYPTKSEIPAIEDYESRVSKGETAYTKLNDFLKEIDEKK
jgi:antitoxin component of RelBE/YafQ-DinJ toxin-antitoxin module